MVSPPCSEVPAMVFSCFLSFFLLWLVPGGLEPVELLSVMRSRKDGASSS